MTWPYDAASTVTLVVAAACLAGAAMRRLPIPARIALIIAAAALIRFDAASQHSLHLWDESYHAVVAKHLVAHPFVPTLYERPLTPPLAYTWTEAHVFLHKPPLALWFMAASMATFGVDEIAARLPSMLLSTFGVLLIYLIGRALYDERVALLAAGFHAVSSMLVSLASGRRVADHVDTALVTCVELSVWLLVSGRHPSSWRAAAAGAAMGAGLLAKSFPALVVLPIAVVLWLRRDLADHFWTRALAFAGGAAIVATPWLVYAQVAFPTDADAALRYTLLHITDVVEGQGGPWWTYLRDLPRVYGELVYLPVAWLAYRVLTRRATSADKVVTIWLAVPYVVFSAMTTKLPAFVAIGAPALFLAQAVFWIRLRDRLPSGGRTARAGVAVLLVLLALSPARPLLAPTGPLERRDRDPEWTRELRALDERIGLPEAVVFNHPRPVQAMFYSRHDIYGRLPTEDEVRALHAINVPIVIFAPVDAVPNVPAAWRAIILRDGTGSSAPGSPRGDTLR